MNDGGGLSSVGEITRIVLEGTHPAPLIRRRCHCHCQARHPSESHGQGEGMTGAQH